MIVTTTPHVDGCSVSEHLGIVSGVAVVGANGFKDLVAGMRRLGGGRSAIYEQEIDRAKQIALDEMTEAAIALGADAVVGADLAFESMGAAGSMLMVSASGTAVRLD